MKISTVTSWKYLVENLKSERVCCKISASKKLGHVRYPWYALAKCEWAKQETKTFSAKNECNGTNFGVVTKFNFRYSVVKFLLGWFNQLAGLHPPLNYMLQLTLFVMGGGGKNAPPLPPPLVFFFKYIQKEKRYDFALLWLLVITYFERFCQISRKKFDWLTSYCDFVRGAPKNSKKKKCFFKTFCRMFQVYIMFKW